MNASEKYYIVTTLGQYCKQNEQGQLVVAQDCSEAVLFTRKEAEERIGKGAKARFYHIEEAVQAAGKIVEPGTPKHESFGEANAMFEGCHYDWEGMLSNLCYMSEHMTEYQAKLYGMQSDVDQKITDVMHYLEFENPNDEELLKSARTLQELRRDRRKITDEVEKTKLVCNAFLDKEFGNKAQQAFDRLERMKTRQYTPRKLTDLFAQHQKESA